jgi:predicted GNAT family acetyltransferase
MPDLTDNAAHHRYDMTVDGHTAYVTYALSNSRVKLIHTEVPKELGGRGLGSVLARRRTRPTQTCSPSRPLRNTAPP